MEINLSSSLIPFLKKFGGGIQILAPILIGFAVIVLLLAAIPITSRQLKELGGYFRLQPRARMG